MLRIRWWLPTAVIVAIVLAAASQVDWPPYPTKWVVYNPNGPVNKCVGVYRADLDEPIVQKCDEFNGQRFHLDYVFPDTTIEKMEKWFKV